MSAGAQAEERALRIAMALCDVARRAPSRMTVSLAADPVATETEAPGRSIATRS